MTQPATKTRRQAFTVVTDSADGWEAPKPAPEIGSAFGFEDRMFWGYDSTGEMVDYSEFEARDLDRLLHGRNPDYKTKQIESVLSLPILSAEREISGVKGDAGEADWLSEYWKSDPWDGGCQTSLGEVVGAMTTAFTFRKNFNEVTFKPDSTGRKVVYDKIGFRPATTCRLRRDAVNGTILGFEQEEYANSPAISTNTFPVKIPANRSFIYIHGQRFDPINGTSDMQVAHWAYRTKQKLLLLWWQFLESVALPRTVVKANDVALAQQIAGQVARMRGSGVVPIGTNGTNSNIDISTLDSSGKGADQFMAAITWLDQAATNSVVAGFLDLTGAATNGIRGGGGGSYALSEDASNYFLQFEEAKCREIERSIRRDLFGPIIRYNFGKNCHVPTFKFEPLNTEDKAQQIAMLTAALAAPPGGPTPPEFVGMLAQQVATYFGMDGAKVNDLFVAAGKAAAATAAAASPAGAAPVGQGVAQMAGAAQAATAIAKTAGQPKKALPPELQHLDWSKLGA